MDRETILQQALSLSIEDRHFLLASIEASLPLGNINGMTDDELTAEIDRRIDAIESGEVVLLDWEDVKVEIQEKLNEMRSRVTT